MTARLKIFFGAASGVGKTFAMLEAACAARQTGVDIAIGAIDTHARPAADALVSELATTAPVELDLDTALARRPAVLLVDDLARTNSPGRRHAHRWQDVIELLDAGIDVWSTLDVTHVASLADVVEQIVGAKVQGAVPDAVLDRADDLVLVDLPPDQRLAEPDPARRGQLLALRELALRRTAERVDADVQRYRREQGIDAPWPTRERIVVCVGSSPGSERLIRATKRMAEGLRATWSAVNVEVVGAPPLGDRDRERLETQLRLAEQLGGEVVRLRGNAIAGPLLAYARAHDVTRVVAGKPTHARWRDRLRGSLLDELIRGSGSIEVHVIAPIGDDDRAAPAALGADRVPPRAYAWAAVPIAFVTALGIAAYDYIALPDITVLYMLAIMIASLLGRGPSLLAASLAVAAFDFCFVPPRWTFVVDNSRYLLTFAVMFAAGLVISTLVVRLRHQEHDAIARERRTAALLALTRDVAAATTVDDIATALARHVGDTLDVAAIVLVPDARDGLVPVAGLMALAGPDLEAARWCFAHRRVAGHGTDTLGAARVACAPLLSAETCVGVVAIHRRPGTPVRLGVDQRHLLDAMARAAAIAIARVQLGELAKLAAVRAHTEELRSSLLSAVSHDLRTPLAVITGAATSLRDDELRLEPGARRELLSSIVADAQRLERVLANLLQLTRVETGMQPAREWIPVEEVIGSTLTRLEDALREHVVDIDVAGDALMQVDPVLFEQAMINLVENALKHGKPPLSIAARRSGGDIVIEIGDRGPGLPPGDGARLFEKFVRASSAPGAGLGLAVVRAIVEAHGGRVVAENRDGGGALFRITAPTPQPPVLLQTEARSA